MRAGLPVVSVRWTVWTQAVSAPNPCLADASSNASNQACDSFARSRDTLYLLGKPKLGEMGILMTKKLNKPRADSKLELKIAEQFQQRVLESAVTAVSVMDLEGRFLTVSQRGVEVTGYSRRELRGKPCTSLVTPNDQSRIQAVVDEVLREGRGFAKLETTIVCKDGTLKSISFDIKPIQLEGKIVGAVATGEDVTAARRAEEALRQSEAELRLLSSRLLDLQDSERRRIARELHDGTAQNLFALNITLSRLLQQAPTETSRNALEECLALCAQTREEIRTLSHVLHPPMLDEAGLMSALKWYVQGFSERSGIKVDLTAKPGLGRLPIDIETDLFRVAQECLANIHRHSGSRVAAVHIERSLDGVTLLIQDWGCGMPPEVASGRALSSPGIGIPGMRERLGQHRGHLNISSNSEGTTITAAIPLRAMRRQQEADRR